MSLPSVVISSVINDMVECASNTPAGAFVEVGVFQGGTAFHLTKLATQQNRKIYLYDTFEGIPFKNEEKGDFHNIGDFNETSYETVKKALPTATVVKGIFPSSAVSMVPISFAHIDCDQYQSIVDSVNYLMPFMVKGGIFWFDDAPDLTGALNAVNDLFGIGNYAKSKTGKIIKVV